VATNPVLWRCGEDLDLLAVATRRFRRVLARLLGACG
jgi:hypothetical protein